VEKRIKCRGKCWVIKSKKKKKKKKKPFHIHYYTIVMNNNFYVMNYINCKYFIKMDYHIDKMVSKATLAETLSRSNSRIHNY